MNNTTYLTRELAYPSAICHYNKADFPLQRLVGDNLYAKVENKPAT